MPNGVSREVGTTERDGRIVLGPRFADDLVVLRLLAGNSEPMVELPVMPGQSETERTIPFDPKPLTVALETQLDSLRDAVIDLIALRPGSRPGSRPGWRARTGRGSRPP